MSDDARIPDNIESQQPSETIQNQRGSCLFSNFTD